MIVLARDFMVCCFQLYMLNNLQKNMFPYKITLFWQRMCVYIIAAILVFGANQMESSVINIAIIPASYMLASSIIFRGSLWKKMIISCCYYMLELVPEFLFASLTNAYGAIGRTEEFQSEIEKTLALLLMNTMTFLLVKCINQVTRKRNYFAIENKYFSLLLTLPVATILILTCIFYSHISFEGINKVMIPVSAVLLLMTNISIFFVFDKLIEKSEEVKQMEKLYQKSRAENINLQYVNKINEDNKAFLHDINKFLRIATNLMINEENQELKKLIEHIGIRIQDLGIYNYCSHPILNSILCERKFVAESKGIAYRIKLGNNLMIDFLKDLDLISIVGNLLDNAIEAAEKTEDFRYVECMIYMGNNDHFLIMEFKNSYIVPPIKEKDRYISSKRDPSSHGIGLHTVKKLVEKYKGLMRIEAGEYEFSVKLMFTIK